MMSSQPPMPPLRLREKLVRLGPSHLADAELLAILISSGSHKKSCLTLAYELLKSFGDLRGVLIMHRCRHLLKSRV